MPIALSSEAGPGSPVRDKAWNPVLTRLYTGITTGTIPLISTMPLRLMIGAVSVITAPAV